MYLTDIKDSSEPLRSPTGEIIYELIGRDEDHGAVTRHSLAHVTIPPGKSSPKHTHHETEESYFILEGMGEMVIDGEEYHLHPGQAVLIEPGDVHQIWNRGKEDLVFLAICGPAWKLEDHIEVEDGGEESV